MHVQPFEKDFRTGSVEVLIFQLANLSAVNRIGPFATEFLHIEMVSTGTDLFIRRKTDTDLAVFDLRMILQIFHSRDNSGHTAFIISPQQRLAVRHNDILFLIIIQFGKHQRRKHDVLFRTQHDIATLISHDTGLHVFSRHIGTCVQMGNETDRRNRLRRIGRQSCHQVTLIIEGYILQPDLFQFLNQCFCKHELSRRTGRRPRRFARLRVERHILQKSICYSHKLIINVTSPKSNQSVTNNKI